MTWGNTTRPVYFSLHSTVKVSQENMNTFVFKCLQVSASIPKSLVSHCNTSTGSCRRALLFLFYLLLAKRFKFPISHFTLKLFSAQNFTSFSFLDGSRKQMKWVVHAIGLCRMVMLVTIVFSSYSQICRVFFVSTSVEVGAIAVFFLGRMTPNITR